MLFDYKKKEKDRYRKTIEEWLRLHAGLLPDGILIKIPNRIGNGVSAITVLIPCCTPVWFLVNLDFEIAPKGFAYGKVVQDGSISYAIAHTLANDIVDAISKANEEWKKQ